MPRIVEITTPAAQTDDILARIQDIPELLSLRVEKGISVQPPGDVITVVVTNNILPRLLTTLDKLNITHIRRHPLPPTGL
jgi:hypothetical protein